MPLFLKQARMQELYALCRTVLDGLTLIEMHAGWREEPSPKGSMGAAQTMHFWQVLFVFELQVLARYPVPQDADSQTGEDRKCMPLLHYK